MSGRGTRRRKNPPIVLIVDDNDDDARAAAIILGSRVKSICRQPNDVRDHDLASANLVLVDLRIEDWQERDLQPTPSLRPKDGLALVATLRSNLSQAASRAPTAFALRSGQLDYVSGEYTYERREHVLAKLYDLEWVFPKSADPQIFATQVALIANAVRSLPHPWPPVERRRKALLRFLALSTRLPWINTANEDLDRAFPPEDILTDTSRGLAVMRWLLQEVFPYPGPLLDERYLAARLCLDPAKLGSSEAASIRARLYRALSPYQYDGVLAGFLGRRWWRAGIEHWLWNRTNGAPVDREAIRKSLRKLITHTELYSPLSHPVVSVDDQFRPTDQLIELKDAVQLHPDDWPQSADAAWALESDVKANPAFMARLDLRDRARASPNHQAIRP